jgi:hypothetical protein
MLGGMRCWTIALLLAALLGSLSGAQDPEEAAFELAGTVLTASGKPANAAVFVWDALAEDRLLAEARTGEDGRFSVAVTREAAARREHPFGPVTVVVHQPGLARAQVEATPGTRDLAFKLQKPGTWEGTVHGADGTALPGAEMAAIQGRTRIATTTDEQGHFYFSDLAPAATVVTADATGYRAATIREGKLAFVLERLPMAHGRLIDSVSKKALEGASIVDLASNTRAVTDDGGRFALEMDGAELAIYLDSYAMTKVAFTGGDLELKRAESVRGTVLDDKGEPVAFASVRLDPGFGVAAMARTDVSGAFEFSVGVANFAVATVNRRGFLPARLSVDPNWRTDRVKFALRRGREIEGIVLNGGDPVLGAEVQFLRALRPTGFQIVGRVFSDGKGEFRMRALPATATVAVARGQAPRSAETLQSAETLRSADTKVEKKMWLRVEAAPAAKGTLRDDTGKRLAGIAIIVDRGGRSETRIKSDEAGNFVVPGDRLATAGTWIDVETGERFLPSRRLVTRGGRLEITLERNLGARKLGVAILPTPRAGYTRVELRGDGWRRVRWLAPKGVEVSFGGLPPGKGTIRIEAPGFQVVERERELQGMQVESLPRAGTIRMKATPGARVFIQTVSGEPAPTVSIKLTTGKKELAGFGPGRYRFLSRASGEAIVAREIDVGERDAPRDLDLTGGKASTMTVTVRNSDGAPVRGAAITLITEGGFPFRTGKRTDLLGKAELSRLILGRVRVVASMGDESSEVTVAIEPGKSHAIDIVAIWESR